MWQSHICFPSMAITLADDGFRPPVDSHGGRRTFSHTYQTHLCFKPQYQMKCYVWQESLMRQCYICFSSMAITLADVSGTDRFLSTCGLSSSHTYQTHLCFNPQYQIKCYVCKTVRCSSVTYVSPAWRLHSRTSAEQTHFCPLVDALLVDQRSLTSEPATQYHQHSETLADATSACTTFSCCLSSPGYRGSRSYWARCVVASRLLSLSTQF